MEPTPAAPSRPVLVFDGDCGFCVYWQRYWQKLTGDRVDYQPYQEAAAQYPHIPIPAFRRAVQYIAPDGKVAAAAEASFLTLSHAPYLGFLLTLYRRLPIFAKVSEAAYAFISAHRPAFYRICLLLWGRDFSPPRYNFVSWVFLRLLGVIYLCAFASFGVQALGLIGDHGILPLAHYLDVLKDRVHDHTGLLKYWAYPMVFWAGASNGFILAVCWGGAALAAALIAGVLPRAGIFLLYFLYLSLRYAGQNFMTYQWDIFLLENGFLGLLLSLWPAVGVWLLRWLLFRFMFLSGTIKLMSGDPSWHSLTALSYHFWTQPLPTPVAWYAARLSSELLAFFTGAALFTELVLPFFLFLPRHFRFAAGFGFFALETAIFMTGNYNFFNLQTMCLCIACFDDAALYKAVPQRIINWIRARAEKAAPNTPARVTVGILAALIVFVSLVQLDIRFGGNPPFIAKLPGGIINPFEIVDTYGLFAVMTKTRPEIIIEGSNDGRHWKEYGFRDKPDDVHKALSWNIPHQPRLDWQLWFAALEQPQENRWLGQLLRRILENSPPVMALLGDNPFPDKPPVFVRALRYEYTFAGPEEREKDGIIWRRKLTDVYFPAARLQPKSIMDAPEIEEP